MDAAIEMAHDYLANPASVDRSLAGTVTRLAARRGDRALLREYRRRFEEATIPAERDLYLGALGAFRDPALVGRTLNTLSRALSAPRRSCRFRSPSTERRSSWIAAWNG
jgi:hypothetical protein